MRGYGKARRAATSSSYQTGDLLRRDLSWYADHYGVYLGRYQGHEWVIEVTRLADQPERATIRTVPLQLFADGKPCTLIEHGTADRAVLRRRVDELLGTAGLNYLLLGGGDGWNCESAARYLATAGAGPPRARRSTRPRASARRACSRRQACSAPA
jgi:hypothetical protein